MDEFLCTVCGLPSSTGYFVGSTDERKPDNAEKLGDFCSRDCLINWGRMRAELEEITED